MIMAVGLWQAVTEGGEQGQADSGGGSGSDWLSGSVGKSGEEAGQVPVPRVPRSCPMVCCVLAQSGSHPCR